MGSERSAEKRERRRKSRRAERRSREAGFWSPASRDQAQEKPSRLACQRGDNVVSSRERLRENKPYAERISSRAAWRAASEGTFQPSKFGVERHPSLKHKTMIPMGGKRPAPHARGGRA